MTFALGRRSRQRLEGVHPRLVEVVETAIMLTRVDFSVFEGLRSVERQRELVKNGKSRTMRSRHLTGHAVDLVPYVHGRLLWEWEHIYPVAEAVRRAAIRHDVSIRWGGVWDRRLDQLTGSLEAQVSAYVRRRRDLGRSAFIDGPHFELPRELYSA